MLSDSCRYGSYYSVGSANRVSSVFPFCICFGQCARFRCSVCLLKTPVRPEYLSLADARRNGSDDGMCGSACTSMTTITTSKTGIKHNSQELIEANWRHLVAIWWGYGEVWCLKRKHMQVCSSYFLWFEWSSRLSLLVDDRSEACD